MKKLTINFFYLTFLSLMSLNLFAQSNAISISGHVSMLKEDQVKLRTPTEDIILSFDKLDKKTKDQITNADPKKKQNLIFSAEAIVKRKDVPMGIRADCSEIPTDMDELGSIAEKSKDMVDFLKKIPEGSLQGFTFVTNSLSLHRGKKDKNGEGQVSPMWPRVLRSSADGKLTVSFVCDPKNPTFGRVEIINFDDKEKEFKTTEFDFGHPNGEKVSPKDRIHKDPVSCISCHAGSEFNGKVSLKPNWPEYFQWSDCKEDRGLQFYGGNDDNMGLADFRSLFRIKNSNCSNSDYLTNSYKEKRNFSEFREKQKNNDCFNTLPWPKDAPQRNNPVQNEFVKKWSYKYYPYAESSQDSNLNTEAGKTFGNYALRTNLRFTDTYSHLMAQRIGNILKKSPNYDTVKYLLAMEQAKCNITAQEMKDVNDLISGVKLRHSYDATIKHSLGSDSPLLFTFSKASGLSEKDWTMEFQETNNPDYVSAMPNIRGAFTGDLTIPRVVGGEVLKDLSETNEQIAKVSKGKITRGVAESFGSAFSCIDDLGGAINIENMNQPDGQKDICDALRSENEKNLAKIKEAQKNCVDCNNVNLPKVERKLAETIEESVKKINVDQIARGKKLVETDSRGKCVMCHSASVDMLPKDFRFIPSENDPKKKESIAVLRARKNEISDKLENRLVKTKTMPPPPLGDQLSDQDRADVKAYLLSVAVGEK